MQFVSPAEEQVLKLGTPEAESSSDGPDWTLTSEPDDTEEPEDTEETEDMELLELALSALPPLDPPPLLPPPPLPPLPPLAPLARATLSVVNAGAAYAPMASVLRRASAFRRVKSLRLCLSICMPFRSASSSLNETVLLIDYGSNGAKRCSFRLSPSA